MKYYEWSKQYLQVLRLIKRSEYFRKQGNWFYAQCLEYKARIVFETPLLLRNTATMEEWLESAKTAPISEIKAEATDNLIFCRKAFSNWITVKWKL